MAEYRDGVGDISIALDNDDEESDSIISSSMSPSKQSTNTPSTGNKLLLPELMLFLLVIITNYKHNIEYRPTFSV